MIVINNRFNLFNWSGTLSFQKKMYYFLLWKPFKNDEKCFLFHLQGFFRPQNIYVFVMTFWSCRKKDLMKKMSACYYHVTYEFQSESTVYSLPECQRTSCSKQAPYLKFKWQQRDSNPQPLSSRKPGQLIEYKKRNFFLQKLFRKWSRETSSRPLYFLKQLVMR